MTELDLSHVSDMAKLTPDQFNRMLPDLVAWFELAKFCQEIGGESTGFIWRDDGRPGEINGITVTDPKTGEEQTLVLKENTNAS